MDATLRNRLEHCSSLPSLPAAAARVVELARDSGTSMGEVAEALKSDPALAAKILRMANSPLYARRRHCESFQQALVLLGLNAVLTLALTFTLVNSLGRESGRGLDYGRVWRRSLLAATASRVLGEHFEIAGAAEELFLAGLLQDIGMLAVDRACPDLYAALDAAEQDHDAILGLERERLGCDHAEVGAWLLERWNLPERLRTLVARSHETVEGSVPGDDVEQRGVRCVALSDAIAELWISGSPETCLEELQRRFAPIPDMDGEGLSALIEKVSLAAPEIEQMFDMALADPQRSEWIMQEAREVIVLRNLQMVQESTRLREVAASLQARARDLEEKTRRDNLTGCFNRGYLDDTLTSWFLDATRDGMPLTVVFVDLDDFKRVNDLYGHHCGDRVLVRSAQTLLSLARATDVVARYGGEEFVLLLPGCGTDGAVRMCQRLLSAFVDTRYELDDGELLRVTVSLGVATHGEGTTFDSAEHLLRAADQSLYEAKQTGKNRFVVYRRAVHAA